MNVRELSMEQLRELKENFFYREEDNGEIENMNKYEYSHDIPDSVIFEEYGGTSFSNDDFSCSSGKSEDEYDIRGDFMERFDEIMDIIGDIESDFRRGKISFYEALADIEDEINMHKNPQIPKIDYSILKKYVIVWAEEHGEDGMFYYFEGDENPEDYGDDGYGAYDIYLDSHGKIVEDNWDIDNFGKTLSEAYGDTEWVVR